MKIQIFPKVALCDEKLTILISGLPPYGKVQVSASTYLPWAKNVLYESFAWFTADSDGNVNLSKQKPDSGTYDFADSMGLIISMKSRDANAIKKISQNISIDNNQLIDIVAQCGQDTESVTIERLYKSKDVKRERISDGFVGELFYTENTDHKTIVLLGGSGSNLAINSLIAAVLASRGFNVLSLPYFNEKGLPAKLAEIPLEYFEKVFTWLSNNPLTKCNEIRLLGQSKGAEIALILASRYHIIKKVVAIAPHAYCFEGLNFKNVSSWTCQGKSLPFIPLKFYPAIKDAIGCMIKNKPFGLTHTHRKCVDIANNKEDARIKVENASADILMFAGKQDGMWNSYDGCVVIMENLKKHDYSFGKNLIVYENAGHPQLPVPYIIPVGENKMKLAPRLVFSMGGTLEANLNANIDTWEKTIEFLKSS